MELKYFRLASGRIYKLCRNHYILGKIDDKPKFHFMFTLNIKQDGKVDIIIQIFFLYFGNVPMTQEYSMYL